MDENGQEKLSGKAGSVGQRDGTHWARCHGARVLQDTQLTCLESTGCCLEVRCHGHCTNHSQRNRYAEYQRLNAYKKEDPKDLLAKITAPTLIMWGEENPQLPVSSVEMFEERLVNVKRLKKIIYPQVGHIIPLENPKQSVMDFEDFLRRFRRQFLHYFLSNRYICFQNFNGGELRSKLHIEKSTF